MSLTTSRGPTADDNALDLSIDQLAPHLVIDRQRELAKSLLGLSVPASLVTGLLGVKQSQQGETLQWWALALLTLGVVSGVVVLRSVRIPREWNLLAIERRFTFAIRANRLALVACALGVAGSMVVASAASIPQSSEGGRASLALESAGTTAALVVSVTSSDECAGEYPAVVLQAKAADGPWVVLWAAGWTEAGEEFSQRATIERGFDTVRLHRCDGSTLAEVKVSEP